MDKDFIPPELIKALSEAGLLDDRLAQAAWSRKQGEEAKNTPMPQGRVTQPGYQAANPMEIWAAVLKQREGAKESSEAQKAMASMLRQYQDAAAQNYANHQAQMAARVPPPVEQPPARPRGAAQFIPMGTLVDPLKGP